VVAESLQRRLFSSITAYAPERMRVSSSTHVAVFERLIAGEREHAATLLWRHLLGASRVKPGFS